MVADSGEAKSKKKKKTSKIISEDMKVQFTDDIINSDDEATTTERLNKYSNTRRFRAKRYSRIFFYNIFKLVMLNNVILLFHNFSQYFELM